MDDTDILGQIRELVEREHQLRSASQSGEIPVEEEQAQLRRVEESLDQCWDLLRQRRAKQEYGQNPEETAVRSADQVEHYLQ